MPVITAPSMDASFEALPAPDAPLGGDRGEPSISASQIAREAAAAAVRGQFTATPTVQPGSTFHEGRPTPQQAPQLDANGLEITPDATPQTPAPSAAQVDYVARVAPADFELLQHTFGIATPEDFDAAPVHIQDAYSELAQLSLEAHQNRQSALREYQDMKMRTEAFAQRLKEPEGQKRIALSIATTSPEVFHQVAEMAERMKTDPEYASLVNRTLQAEIALEATQRAQAVDSYAGQMTKGQAVESRVERLAQRLGVDSEEAKSRVTDRILRNEATTGKRDISFQEVDEVVNHLAKISKAQPAKQQPRTPAAQQRQQAAPQVPAQAAAEASRAPSPSPARNPVQPSTNALDKLRAAVRLSSDRIRGQGL